MLQSEIEVGESSGQSKPNVWDTTQQQLAMFRHQLAAFEATFGAFTYTPSLIIPTTLSMYSKNPVTLFSNLSSTYVSRTVCRSLYKGEA